VNPLSRFFKSAQIGQQPRLRQLRLRQLLIGWLVILVLVLAPTAAGAIAVKDLPSTPPASLVLDSADVLSRAARASLEQQLEAFHADRVEARLVTVERLDYGLSLDALGQELLEGWSTARENASSQDGGPSTDGILLLLVDSQTKAAAVLATPQLQRQLPPELLRSTARTTMAVPLKEGNRYLQASTDGLQRLATVLRGGEDPGEPQLSEDRVVITNIPSREETASSNAFNWVVVLLVVGSVVPMLTWWVFSR
jgi:uncharacterized protein